MINKMNRINMPRVKRFAVAILLALSVALIPSMRTQSQGMKLSAQETRYAYSESYSSEADLDYAGAIDAIVDVYSADKSGYMVNLRMGWLHYLNGEYSDAENYYRAAVKAAPAAVEARIGYLLPLLAEEKYDEAESVAYQVLNDDRNNYYASLRLVYALRMQGKYALAEELALDMLDLYPTDVSFLTELALVYEWKGDTAEADKVFWEILLLDPDNAIATQYLEG